MIRRSRPAIVREGHRGYLSDSGLGHALRRGRAYLLPEVMAGCSQTSKLRDSLPIITDFSRKQPNSVRYAGK